MYSENDTFSDLNVEGELTAQVCKNNVSVKNEERKYSKQEIDSILREGLEDLITELEKVIKEKFANYNLKAEYNKCISNWNEVLCSVKINGKFINLKLSNDYLCNNSKHISSVYITLFGNCGVCAFTECIKRIKQEYEFIDHTYAHVPAGESELYFKMLDKNKSKRKKING
ncbi:MULTISPECIES: hypothetical protein [unclassified Clostridium]|uniref:hypothetical protein n=1 Tax=unclassified Clostridium TaxID=2614128 RepID=UPI0002974E8A|nr:MULTISPECIES: hypothetical protein [unclassified Clostridium]EKQ57128.1 MAG: hypothetical protein A370_01227 [Clostridium sp. Maddingley MBC34-26]